MSAWRLYKQELKSLVSRPALLKTLDAGKLDPVIGRDDEIDRVICILCRRTKNCAALVGAAGVGKTAVAEGLALRIAAGDVPDALAGARVAELDVGAMVAGTRWRGMFEQRLKDAIAQAEDSDGKLILFIDEMHMIVGAGDRGGTGDAANILKPALARGRIRCVGATTSQEYRKHIEKDSALERRFQKVDVDEPSVEATIAILQGLKKRYQKHHGLIIDDDALVAAVRLADRYITGIVLLVLNLSIKTYFKLIISLLSCQLMVHYSVFDVCSGQVASFQTKQSI
jgi:ATP-dependent Clp protease ATP-binding subunit ClpA